MYVYIYYNIIQTTIIHNNYKLFAFLPEGQLFIDKKKIHRHIKLLSNIAIDKVKYLVNKVRKKKIFFLNNHILLLILSFLIQQF